MMEHTAPEEYDALKDRLPYRDPARKVLEELLVSLMMDWTRETAEKFPPVMSMGRSLSASEDGMFNTSSETYLKGELGTYSDKTLKLYAAMLLKRMKDGRNPVRETLEHTVAFTDILPLRKRSRSLAGDRKRRYRVMAANKLYSIGEVSKLCNISTKALRFYDKIGVIAPDEVGENGYRYYTLDTILRIPILKYYKQMGFRLEEMQGLVKGGDYYVVGSCFRSKINELREQEHAIHNSYVSVKDWYELIQEARAVLYNKIQEVGMRYVSEDHYCYMDQEFEYHYMDSIINIPWVNYLDTVKMRSPGR